MEETMTAKWKCCLAEQVWISWFDTSTNLQEERKHSLCLMFMEKLLLCHAGTRFKEGSTSTAPMAGWLDVTGEMDFSMTQEQLRITGKAWIARAATPTERDKQILHMRTIKKEPNITVEQFESNILLTAS